MTISQKKVTARKQYHCVSCFKDILKGQSYYRLFGMAEAGDKPYAIKLCETCVVGEKPC